MDVMAIILTRYFVSGFAKNNRGETISSSMSWIHEVKQPIITSNLLMENSVGKTTNFLVVSIYKMV